LLPDFLSVYFDPTLKKFAGTELVGYYPYDDEGVKAHRVTVVDKGILKNFLMSRAPIEGFDRSNGHGRLGNRLHVHCEPPLSAAGTYVHKAQEIEGCRFLSLLPRYGFRSGRGQHQALDEVGRILYPAHRVDSGD